jgi:hypothetical protein
MAEDRGMWTIKSKEINHEMLNTCRAAAKRKGLNFGDWAARRLYEAALADLGKPVEEPKAGLPATQLDAQLMRGLFAEWQRGMESRLVAIQQGGTLAAARAAGLAAEQIREMLQRERAASPAPPDPPRAAETWKERLVRIRSRKSR